MKPGARTLYQALDSNARAWWWFRELRAAGKVAEARKLERESIRGKARALRLMRADPHAHVAVGHGGASLHYSWDDASGRGSCSHGIDRGAAIDCARFLGLPLLDCTVLDQHDPDLWDWSLRGPIIADSPARVDPRPWGGFSYCPLAYRAAWLDYIGGRVWNVPGMDEYRAEVAARVAELRVARAARKEATA